MNRTRKWEYVRQDVTRFVKLGMTPSQIEKKLDGKVTKSTINKWIAAGKLQRGAPVTKLTAAQFNRSKKSASAWAKSVRSEYLLNETDDQLVTLAETALVMSKDPAAKNSEKLNAARLFQSIVDQLNFVARSAPAKPEAPEKGAAAVNGEPPAPTKNPVTPRPTGEDDPRRAYMAVVK